MYIPKGAQVTISFISEEDMLTEGYPLAEPNQGVSPGEYIGSPVMDDVSMHATEDDPPEVHEVREVRRIATQMLSEGYGFLNRIDVLTPSRYNSLARTKVEEALMWMSRDQ